MVVWIGDDVLVGTPRSAIFGLKPKAVVTDVDPMGLFWSASRVRADEPGPLDDGRTRLKRMSARSSRSTLISTALRRGLRKRCPHCGEGPLFSGWSQLERCSICGLVFARNPGDTWAFTIFGDRLPLAAMIVLIYFGVLRWHRVLGLTMLAGLAVLVVWTAPNRWGAGIALHYLSRVYWPDPADPIPPSPAIGPRQ